MNANRNPINIRKIRLSKDILRALLPEHLQIMSMKSILLGVALLLGVGAMAGSLEVAPAVKTETPSVASEQETELVLIQA